MSLGLFFVIVGVLSAALQDAPVALMRAYVEVAPAWQAELLKMAEVAGCVYAFNACGAAFNECFVILQLCDGFIIYKVAEVGLFGVGVCGYYATVMCVEVAQLYLIVGYGAEFGHERFFFAEEAYQANDEVEYSTFHCFLVSLLGCWCPFDGYFGIELAGSLACFARYT